MIDRKFLFFVERELHLPQLKPIMEYINDNDLGHIGIFSFVYNSSAGEMVQSGLRVETINKEINFEIELVEDPYNFKPEFTFMADFSYHFVEGLGKIINVGHGTISKGWFFTDRNISKRENCADLICVPGTVHKEILDKQVFKKVEVTGMPKLDRLFTANWDKNIELQKLNLNPENKTVLFAPTFNRELSILPFLDSDLHKYIPSFLNIIIKLHGATSDDCYRKYEQFAQTHKNVYFSKDLDITKYLFLGDVLITDVSSVIYEFASTGKPVLCFDSPQQKKYINYNPNDLEYVYRDIATQFIDVNNLQELLFKVMTSQNPKSDISEKFISITDGTSAKKVVDAALKLDENRNATIIVDNCNDAKKQTIKNKYSDRFYLNFITNVEKQDSSSMELFLKYAKNAHTNKIIYFDAQFALSPQLPNLMMAHFHYNPDCGIIVPLKPNSGIISQQNIESYIKQANKMNNYQIGFQITYSNPGVSRPIKFPENSVFAISKNDINFDIDANNDRSYWYAILKQISDLEKEILLAFDCYIYVDDSSNEVEIDEEYEKKIVKKDTSEIDKANSVFENFDYSEDDFGAKSLANSIENKVDNVQESEREYALKRALEDDPFNNSKIKELIYYYLENLNYESAETFANMIPEDSEANLLSAICLDKQNLMDLALQKIESINDVSSFEDKMKVMYYTSIAKIKMKNNKMFEVKNYIEKALKIEPDNLDALLSFGSYYILNQDYDSAKIYLTKAYSLSPKNIKANFGMALVLQNQSKYSEAISHYKFCVEKNIDDMNSIDGLVKCSYQIGEFEDTFILVDKFLDIHPENTDMLFVASNILYSLKRYKKALEYVKRLLLLDPEFKSAKELEDQILQEAN
ncbi:MAG: CDP-glycerol glycerophosphotransferase family protein [Candidatus Cloacimonadota bacterium]|nr:CDP-glycerol glycerophosphotransferase family protein [Candidatus Cloacimonadota bacterium]